MPLYERRWVEVFHQHAHQSSHDWLFAYLDEFKGPAGEVAIPASFMATRVLPDLIPTDEVEMVWGHGRVEHLEAARALLVGIHNHYDLGGEAIGMDGERTTLAAMIQSPALQSLVLLAIASSGRGLSMSFINTSLDAAPEWTLFSHWLLNHLTRLAQSPPSSRDFLAEEGIKKEIREMDHARACCSILLRLLSHSFSRTRERLVVFLITQSIIPQRLIANALANLGPQLQGCAFNQTLSEHLSVETCTAVLAITEKQTLEDVREHNCWRIATDAQGVPDLRFLDSLAHGPPLELQRMRFVVDPFFTDCTVETLGAALFRTDNSLAQATVVGLMILHHLPVAPLVLGRLLCEPAAVHRIRAIIGMPYASAAFLYHLCTRVL